MGDIMALEQNAKDALAALADIEPGILDQRAENGDTILIEKITYSKEMVLPKLKGGWALSYCGRFSDGYQGVIYLIPDHKWTRGIWNKGQVRNAIKQGLSEEQAQRWIDCSLRYKHRLLSRVIDLINDAEKRKGYAAYRPDFTQDEYQQWSARSGISDRLSPSLRTTLIKLYTVVTEKTLDE